MKYEIQYSGNHVCLCDLNEGDLFMPIDADVVYMKILVAYSELPSNRIYNSAVNMETGEVEELMPLTFVRKYNCDTPYYFKISDFC